jgi:hypothetical protein
MASEVGSKPQIKGAFNFNIQDIAGSISAAASLQPKESVERAVEAFTSFREKQISFLDLPGAPGHAILPSAGHADHPLQYLTQEYKIRKDASYPGIFSMPKILSSLGQPNLRFQKGVASFLNSGIQESLKSLNIPLNSKLSRPSIPIPLDELISNQKLKNPDRSQMQISLQIMDEMFSTLKVLQNDYSDLELNMLRSIRA